MNKERRIILAIPARLSSSRLPKKVLADIGGKSMLIRVLEQCKLAMPIEDIFLCTDSEELKSIAEKNNFKVIMTSKSCSSGSDRISSVVNTLVSLAWSNYQNNERISPTKLHYQNTAIINIQGDQPFLNPDIIKKMCLEFEKSKIFPKVITPIYPLEKNDIHNPNVVKTLVSNQKLAIYFSRQALPFVRDTDKDAWHSQAKYWGHVGIYGYRSDILLQWRKLPFSNLENLEKLEQLRLIDNGININTFEVNEKSLSVDTFEQLEYARKIANKLG